MAIKVQFHFYTLCYSIVTHVMKWQDSNHTVAAILNFGFEEIFGKYFREPRKQINVSNEPSVPTPGTNDQAQMILLLTQYTKS